MSNSEFPEPFSPLAAVEALRAVRDDITRTHGHPTKRIVAKVTCVIADDDGTFEITVEDRLGPAERWGCRNWRFTVADASHYPVGSTIGLTVPA
jgi:hypothetical protein